MNSDSSIAETPKSAGNYGIVAPDWRVDIFPVPERTEIVRQFLYHCFEPFAHDRVESVVLARSVYTHIIKVVGDWIFRENSAGQVEANLKAVERINARWPGVFRSVRRPFPEISDPVRIAWVVDYLALWSGLRATSPTMDEVYAEALHPSPPVTTVASPPCSRRTGGDAFICHSKILYQPLDASSLLTRVLAEILLENKPDWVEQPVRAADIYNHFVMLSPGVGTTVQSTPEQVNLIVTAIGRLNARWPGAFLEVRPAIPMPDHAGRILWIYEAAKIGSDPGVSDPTLEEVVQTALGNVR